MSSHPKPSGEWCSHHPRAKPQPANRNVAWYRRTRTWLIAELGGKCVECGTTDELEFDHLTPRDWHPNKTSRWQRLRNYIKDWRRGIAEGVPRITLRCRSCNGRKGYPDGQLELLDAAEERRKKRADAEPF